MHLRSFVLMFALSLGAEADEITPPQTRHLQACTDGMAAGYACERVDLLAHMPLSDIGGGSGSDIWGWTDPESGREFALVGRSNGTAFVELIGHPQHVLYLGNLPAHAAASDWRDIKTYSHYAFIVSEAENSGMQVFDLNNLLNVANPPVTFTETTHYAGFGRAHNIVINEDSATAYGVGSRQGATQCNSGLHIVDISDPLSPAFEGCFSADGYTHDAQCVMYDGPDTAHAGQEICLNSNEDTLTIVDVTDPTTPLQLSRTGYSNVGYTHQGWLTEDHRYFLMNDETDEIGLGHNTRTIIWDVADLDAPVVIGEFFSDQAATDHNLYVRGNYVYQANYTAGLRILSLDQIAAGTLEEVAWFDTYPTGSSAGTIGAWSVYPYFATDTVIVSDIVNGLFVLRPILCSEPNAPEGLSATPDGDHRIALDWNHLGGGNETFDIYRSLGNCPVAGGELLASDVGETGFVDDTASGQLSYAYEVRARDETGLCASANSNCAEATTTGSCTAPPSFAGLASATNVGGATCAAELEWAAATANCGADVTYNVYGFSDSGFQPGPTNLLASGLTALQYTDTAMISGLPKHYVARAVDSDNGVEDQNLLELTVVATGPNADGTWATGAEIGDPTLTQGSGRHIGWEIVSNRAHTGKRSFFSTYADSQCSRLTMPALQLTAGESSELSLWTAYDIESRWDGGVVELSDDGGNNWAVLTPVEGYPDTFRSSSDACEYPTGTGAFTGTNLNWEDYTFDLSAYNGSEVLIRFSFSTDGFQTEEGWYIDDIALTHAQVPGQCVGLEDVIFSGSFD